jgi:hypothetical protein
VVDSGALRAPGLTEAGGCCHDPAPVCKSLRFEIFTFCDILRYGPFTLCNFYDMKLLRYETLTLFYSYVK